MRKPSYWRHLARRQVHQQARWHKHAHTFPISPKAFAAAYLQSCMNLGPWAACKNLGSESSVYISSLSLEPSLILLAPCIPTYKVFSWLVVDLVAELVADSKRSAGSLYSDFQIRRWLVAELVADSLRSSAATNCATSSATISATSWLPK